MTQPAAELHSLTETSPWVELFTLDATAIGGSVYRFTNTPNDGQALVFDAQSYAPLPIQAEGFDQTSTGAPARPTLTVSNVSGALLGAVISLGDLVGCRVERVRTFARYLDTGSSPDPTRRVGPDIYLINRKTLQNKNLIQFELISPLDRQGIRLPRRQILKDKGFPGVSRTRVA